MFFELWPSLMFPGAGSYKCRAGWVTDDKPRLIFKNVVARQRSKKVQDELFLVHNIINVPESCYSVCKLMCP